MCAQGVGLVSCALPVPGQLPKDESLTLAVTSLCGVSFPFRVWMFSKVGSRIFSFPIARPGQVPLVECLEFQSQANVQLVANVALTSWNQRTVDTNIPQLVLA